MTRIRRSSRCSSACLSGGDRLGRRQWQLDQELATSPMSFTAGLETSGVKLHQPTCEREADAQSRLRGARLSLREEIEDTRQQLRRNPDSGIDHRNRHLRDGIARRRRDRCGDAHRTAVVREFRRVVQQVRQDLHEPCRIDIDDALVLWQVDAQVDVFGSQGGTIRLPRRCGPGSRASVGSRWSAILPEVILDTSRRSSIRRTM